MLSSSQTMTTASSAPAPAPGIFCQTAPAIKTTSNTGKEAESASEQRLSALEREVTSLRQEMNLIRPTVQDLIASKRRAQTEKSAPTSGETKKPEQKTLAQAHRPRTPDLKKENAKEPVSAKPSAAQKDGATLSSLRVGEHPGRTRVVLEVGQKTPFHYDLDNEELLLIIELPEATPAIHEPFLTGQSPYISAITLQPVDKGSRLILQLKTPVKVLAAEPIPATASQDARIFFDIGP
ncbi:MAG: hypothetical protein H6863_01135 [Rhodospirillales bacterium]|nr:hypothetical protein [Rhodospirillales bacterium]